MTQEDVAETVRDMVSKLVRACCDVVRSMKFSLFIVKVSVMHYVMIIIFTQHIFSR